jgi:hypothetical protein
MAVAQSSAVDTATAGPNSSSVFSGAFGATSSTTAGVTRAPSRRPPVSSVAPPSTAAWSASSTRRASASLIRVPNRVPSSDGFP